MELKEKLQALRKQKGLTQEELAAALFVSRTAVSKWESGRGTPNLDSLKAIAALFSVSLDQLLSDDAPLPDLPASQESRANFRDLIFGLLDIGAAMTLVLPCFGQQTGEGIREVSLLQLQGVSCWLLTTYRCVVLGMVLCGIATLALQNWNPVLWARHKRKLSLALGALAALVFILSLQPYAAIFFCILLAIKGCLAVKRQ